jgi:hypothetical protein
MALDKPREVVMLRRGRTVPSPESATQPFLTLAPLVRKGSNLDSLFGGLSPPVSEDRVAGVHLYPLRRCERRFKREPVCPALNEPESWLAMAAAVSLIREAL